MHQFPIKHPDMTPSQLVNYHNQLKITTRSLPSEELDDILYHRCIQQYLEYAKRSITRLIQDQNFDLLARYCIGDIDDFVCEVRDYIEGGFYLDYNKLYNLLEAMYHPEMDEINNHIIQAIPSQSDIFEE